jgi:hypothetical protein
MPSDVRKSLNLAYQAYSKIPEHLKYNQEIFMRFVLPYRNLNEPVEAGLRRYFFTRYHWVFDRMHQYGSMHQAACDLLDSLNISFHHLYRYPFVMPLSNCYRIRLGNSCDSMVNLAVFIFRSLGIPVAYDYTPIWPVGAGNLGKGHAWLAFLLNDTVYGIDIPDKKMMNRLYKHEVLPKIYRRTYEKNQISSFFPNSLDVTNQYRNTVNVPVNQRENTGKSLLNVFNSVRGWVSIDESVNQRGNHYFGTIAL